MRMRDWSSDVCCSDLQAMLAIRAAHEPATVGVVAERLSMKPLSATGLIDRLEAAGLVSRHSSAQDRRLSVLELTPRAHALLFSLSATHRDEIRRLKPLLTELLLKLLSLHARSCGIVRKSEQRVAIDG